MNRSPNFLTLTLFINGLLFIILYNILSSNARLVSDDFYYLWLQNSFGSWGGMMYQYENWSGRWTAHFIACGLLKFRESYLFLPLLNFATLISLFLALRYGLEKIFFRLEIKDSAKLPGLTFMLIISFFFATKSTGESWFWYIIVITYMWSLISFLFVLNFIFSRKRFLLWIPASVAAIYCGGASESLALIFMIILASIFIWKKNNGTDKEIQWTTIILFLLIAISFIISYLAAGTEIRRSLLPQTTMGFKAWAYIKSLGKYIITYLPQHAGYLFLFSFPWLVFGNNLPRRFDVSKLKKILRKSTIIFIALLLLSLVPTVYIMSDAGPDRAYIFISLITTIYSAFIFFTAGLYLRKEKIFQPVSTIISILSALVLSFFIYSEYKITSAFAHQYDLNMERLEFEKEHNTGNAVLLSPLPNPGMLYWEELSPDSAYFTNQHLKKGLDLPFSVALINK